MTAGHADVCIIGGGLIGCFSAYFLRQRGKSVTIIEKGEAGAAASGVNFGNLRLQGRHPAEFPLSLRAHAVWEDLSHVTGEDCGFVPCGHVYLAFADGDLLKIERAARDATAADLDVDVLDGAEAQRRWPVLSGVVKGASWSKRDAIADPALAAPAVARLAVRAGAQLLDRTKVVAVETSTKGFRITTDTGHTAACGQVVNAAGAWAGELAQMFGEPVPMFAAGPPLFTILPEHAYSGPSLHAVDGTLLLRPGRGGEAVAGFFPRVRADLASGTAKVPMDRVERGLARLSEVAPGLGRLRQGRVWSGVEGYLPDMLPVVGWSGTTPGLLHVFGFSGHGYQLAPGVGAVVADLLTDGASATPIDVFTIRRFAGNVIPDEKLWSEFDPELVAKFRQMRASTTNA
jgi:sarcosine oxidase subunit beta